MKTFTLKIIENEGTYIPDTDHPFGGIDVEQRIAFMHICPKGYCFMGEIEELEFLAKIHGWELDIRTKNKK